jgi:hypothetical protein
MKADSATSSVLDVESNPQTESFNGAGAGAGINFKATFTPSDPHFVSQQQIWKQALVQPSDNNSNASSNISNFSQAPTSQFKNQNISLNNGGSGIGGGSAGNSNLINSNQNRGNHNSSNNSNFNHDNYNHYQHNSIDVSSNNYNNNYTYNYHNNANNISNSSGSTNNNSNSNNNNHSNNYAKDNVNVINSSNNHNYNSSYNHSNNHISNGVSNNAYRNSNIDADVDNEDAYVSGSSGNLSQQSRNRFQLGNSSNANATQSDHFVSNSRAYDVESESIVQNVGSNYGNKLASNSNMYTNGNANANVIVNNYSNNHDNNNASSNNSNHSKLGNSNISTSYSSHTSSNNNEQRISTQQQLMQRKMERADQEFEDKKKAAAAAQINKAVVSARKKQNLAGAGDIISGGGNYKPKQPVDQSSPSSHSLIPRQGRAGGRISPQSQNSLVSHSFPSSYSPSAAHTSNANALRSPTLPPLTKEFKDLDKYWESQNSNSSINGLQPRTNSGGGSGIPSSPGPSSISVMSPNRRGLVSPPSQMDRGSNAYRAVSPDMGFHSEKDGLLLGNPAAGLQPPLTSRQARSAGASPYNPTRHMSDSSLHSQGPFSPNSINRPRSGSRPSDLQR